MIAHLLQDWVTLRGTTATSEVRQTETEWLTLDGFRDASAWLQVTDAGGDADIDVFLDTAPTADESLFRPLLALTGVTAGVYTLTSIGNLVVDPALVPLERLLRWRVAPQMSAADWYITFRLFVCLNPAVRGASLLRGGEPLLSTPMGGL